MARKANNLQRFNSPSVAPANLRVRNSGRFRGSIRSLESGNAKAKSLSQGSNKDKASARQIKTDMTSKNQNNYRFGTKEEVQALHASRYRDIRAAFGMSAG